MSTASQPQQPMEAAGVRDVLAKMLDDGRRDDALSMVSSLIELNEKLLTDNSKLEWRLQVLLRQLYRKKSEKISPDQLALFLAQLSAEEAAQANVESETSQAQSDTPVPGSGSPSGSPATKKPPIRPVRKPLPANLRREERTITLPPEQLRCQGCSGQKTQIGVDVRERLEFKPAELFVIRECLIKYACKCCADGVATGETTPRPIEGGHPGPGLLAKIVVDKYEDSTPLYRQAKQWGRLGFELPTSTMGDWVAGAADLLEPLWKLARAETLRRTLMSIDDTKLPVLDRDHPNGIKKGHLWVFLGDFDDVMFAEYMPTWEGDKPCAILGAFTGKFVQADGYAGIDEYFETPGSARRVGCLGHCRRKFVAALDAKDLRAAVPISLFAQLYAVEDTAREEHASRDDLLDRRQRLSKPIMTRLGQIIHELRGKAEPKSPLGKAITYAVNQWPTLLVFLDDPRIPIDNLHVERRHRTVALGRRNYLFCGSDEGARRHAIISTVLGNCAIAGVNPFEYLRDVIAKIAAHWPASRLAELMPRAWAAAQQISEHADTRQLASQ